MKSKMKISILTLFPECFDYFKISILGRAIDRSVFDVRVVDIREYSTDRHKKCDDTPYGGGTGMLLTAQPIYDCIQAIDSKHSALRIFLAPTGKVFDDIKARELASQNQEIILLCGHYEGVDQRILDLCMDQVLSIGDYILTGGELAALVVVDCVARYCSGVLGSEFSNIEESFANGLLEYPQYTRPQEFHGLKVPDVLLSGNHKMIAEWRSKTSLDLTKKNRPDLIR
ncbi:MAG: tRNA (guanosine(37)-N1)-methyltransferase TrmD [Clostridiales bacterium]|jgi:tRNA (guanine37-N1)-methyltransferase|nr:tRNA (guanosine(37)-N1)-methyltransferase TrmD [Clostridiales bacterium]